MNVLAGNASRADYGFCRFKNDVNVYQIVGPARHDNAASMTRFEDGVARFAFMRWQKSEN